MAVELREIPVPEIGDTDVLLRVGAVSVCGSDIHQAHNTHSWPVNIPGRARTRVRRHGRRARARGARREGRRSRRQRDGGGDLRQLHDVPHGPLQPVPDAQRLRLRRERRDGGLRESAGALPARDSRQPAVRIRVPRRAALRRVSVDVRQFDDPAGRRGRRARARADRPAVHAHGGARRARIRWSWPASPPTSRGSKRRSRSARRTSSTCRRNRSKRSCARSIRSARNWSATRQARAVRSTWR